jgi:hypothetical protein
MFFQVLQLLVFNVNIVAADYCLKMILTSRHMHVRRCSFVLQHPALSQPQSVTSFNMVMGAGGVRPKGGFQWAGVLMDWAASEGH